MYVLPAPEDILKLVSYAMRCVSKHVYSDIFDIDTVYSNTADEIKLLDKTNGQYFFKISKLYGENKILQSNITDVMFFSDFQQKIVTLCSKDKHKKDVEITCTIINNSGVCLKQTYKKVSSEEWFFKMVSDPHSGIAHDILEEYIGNYKFWNGIDIEFPSCFSNNVIIEIPIDNIHYIKDAIKMIDRINQSSVV